RGAAVAGGLSDGGRDHDNRPVEFYWPDGTAYCAHDGLPSHDAVYRNVGANGGDDAGHRGLAGQNGAVPVSDSRRAAVDLYRRAVLYLFVEKAESVIKANGNLWVAVLVFAPSSCGRGLG